MKQSNLFYLLVFLYFLTLSADQLYVQISFFKPKINHLLALALGGVFLFSRPSLRIDKKILGCFCLIFLSASLSLFASHSIIRSSGYLVGYVFYFLFNFLLPFNLLLRCETKKIFSLYFASFLCIGGYALLQLLLSVVEVYDPFVRQTIGSLARPNAFSYEPSYYALYMTAFVMFYNAKKLLEENVFSRKNLLKLFCVNVLLLLSTSTGGFFAYFIFAVVVLCFFFFKGIDGREHFKKNFLKMSSLFFVVFSLFAFSFQSFVQKTFFKFFTIGGFLHGSFYERFLGIKYCWDIFLAHPWLGIGVGGVGPYQFQLYQGDGPINTLEEIAFFDPTNVFTEVLASLGIVGLSCFVFLIYIFFQRFCKICLSTQISQEEKKMVFSLFLSLVVLVVVLQFSQGLFRTYVWVHAALTFGLMYKIQETEALPARKAVVQAF